MGKASGVNVVGAITGEEVVAGDGTGATITGEGVAVTAGAGVASYKQLEMCWQGLEQE